MQIPGIRAIEELKITLNTKFEITDPKEFCIGIAEYEGDGGDVLKSSEDDNEELEKENPFSILLEED